MTHQKRRGEAESRGSARWIAATAIVALLTLTNATEGGPRSATSTGAPAGGIPNPADDRLRMVAQLEQVNASLQAIQAALERGGIRVEVTKLPPTK